MSTIKIVAVIFAMSFAATSNAALIDRGDYTNINGLDWLDLSLTDGMTLNDALTAFPQYRVATSVEYADMWAEFDQVGDSVIFGIDASSYVNSTGLGYEMFKAYDSNWASNPFFDLFGMTQTQFSSSAWTYFSQGLYFNGSNYQLGGLVLRDYHQTYQADELYSYYNLGYNYDSSTRLRDRSRGFFMVRESQDVAEPQVFALMMIGALVGAGVRVARRKKSGR